MVLYRKYRPQKISELDSEEIKARLVRVLSSSYTPHAFLFAGPKGTGKTSAARIVAKVLNCERKASSKSASSSKEEKLNAKRYTLNADNIEPCNSCEACLAITQGRHLDIIEIDAASNRGIEEIRDLRDKIKLAPVSAKKKVYIIDEVHMLTNEAFNALLKTLEEPPSHAVFILATTEAERLPLTIVSRCIVFRFQKAAIPETINCLKRVIKGEGLSFSDEFLALIAGSCDGSFRDATKILEQAISEKIDTPMVLSHLLGKENTTAERLLRLLKQKNSKETLSQVVKMAENGTNVKFLVEDILHLLHKILIARHGVEEDKVGQDLVQLFEKNDILILIKLFSRVYVEIRSASNAYLPLEVAVVEWCGK